MPTTLHIDSIGNVEVDDHFRDLSPDAQQDVVAGIIASARGNNGASATSGPSATSRPSRNNNPGNLKSLPQGQMWKGQTGTDPDGFAVFSSREAGERAADRNLAAYGRKGINTVAGVVSTWAPSGDHNDTAAYVASASKALGVDPHATLNLADPSVRSALLTHGIYPNEGPGGSASSDQPTLSPAPLLPPKPAAPTPLAPSHGWRDHTADLARTQGFAPKPSQDPNAPGFIGRQVNALNDGIADTLGAPVDGINFLLGKIGVPTSATPFGGSESIRDEMRALGMEHDGQAYAPQTGIERYVQAAARGVGQSIVPGLGMEAMASRGAIRPLSAAARALLTEARAGAASGVGAQTAKDVAPGNPYAELAGSLIGGGVGAGAIGDVRAVVKDARARNLVRDQFATNPQAAAVDGSVYNDLSNILSSLPTKANGKPLPSSMTDRTALSRIATLDNSYMPDLKAFDLMPSQRSLLASAIDNRQILQPAEIDSLRSIPQAGPIVADAIVRSQRLRNAVPEVLGSQASGPSALGIGGEALATGAAAAVAGPKGAILARMATAGIGNTLRRDVAGQAVATARARAALAPYYDAEAGRLAATNDAAQAATSSSASTTAPGAAQLQASMQSLFDKGASADAIRQFAASNGMDPAAFKGLDEAAAYRDKGGKGAQIGLPASAPATVPNATPDAIQSGYEGSQVAPAAAPASQATPNDGGSPSTDVRDAAYLSAKATKAAKAKAALDAAKLTDANRRVAVQNAQDNIPAQGGWRGYLQDQTGLPPASQDAAALNMLANGKISLANFKAHLDSPDALQPGGAGLAMADRMKVMADNGDFQRDPNWSPPSSPQAAPDAGTAIRNPLAYTATAAANQARVTQAASYVMDHPTLPATAKDTIGSAIAQLGSTSDRATADGIVADTVAQLPKAHKADALSILSPLASQIQP